MNWAGNERSNTASLRSGAPCRANGIDPESYQASVSSGSSASEPTQVTCCSRHTHSASGVPQYLVRDSAQSTLLRSHSPYRPCLIVGGCQLVFSFSARSSSLMAVVRMNQDGSA